MQGFEIAFLSGEFPEEFFTYKIAIFFSVFLHLFGLHDASNLFSFFFKGKDINLGRMKKKNYTSSFGLNRIRMRTGKDN